MCPLEPNVQLKAPGFVTQQLAAGHWPLFHFGIKTDGIAISSSKSLNASAQVASGRPTLSKQVEETWIALRLAQWLLMCSMSPKWSCLKPLHQRSVTQASACCRHAGNFLSCQQACPSKGPLPTAPCNFTWLPDANEYSSTHLQQGSQF